MAPGAPGDHANFAKLSVRPYPYEPDDPVICEIAEPEDWAELVNRPVIPTNAYTFDGHMRFEHSGAAPVYAPNSAGRPWAEGGGRAEDSWESDGDLVRAAATLHSQDDDFGQAHALVRDVFSEEDRAQLVNTIVDQIVNTDVVEPVRSRIVEYWTKIDAEVGADIAGRI